MKYLTLLFFSLQLHAQTAQWCDVKDLKTGAVLYTYSGVCDQHKFGGPWGDPTQTKHVTNTTKATADAAQAKVVSDAEAAHQARIDKLKTACANQTNQLLQAICDRLINDLN